MTGRKKKTLWIIAAILICVILLGVYHDRRTCWGSNDFDTFYFAGGLAASGENLYTHQAFKTTLSPFLYLPFFAILVAPLSFMHIRLAAIIWYLINILSLVGSFYVAIKLISVKGDNLKMFLEKPYLIKAVSLVLLIIAWVDNVSLAQVDFMVFFLILLSLLAYEKKRPFLSGIIIAAAGVIKIYPLYFLLYFLLKRRFKAVTGFIVGILLFALIVPWVVLGQDNFNGSMKSWVEMRAMPHLQSAGDDTRENYARCESQFKPSNQAFSAIIMRYFMQDSKDVVEWKTVDFKYKIYWPHPLTPKQVDTLIKVLLLLVLLISYAGLDYKRAYRDNIYLGLEYSVIFLSMLLFFPMVKSHTFAPMLFPLVVFNYLKTTRGEKQLYNSRWMEKTFWAAVVLYCLQAFRYMQVLGAGCLSIVLLWILFIGMLRKEKKLRLES